MPNTKIAYCYRDAGNYKQFNEVVVIGELSDSEREQIWKSLSTDADNGFIPEQVGLEPLQSWFEDDGSDDDHPWHSLEAIESTEDDSTIELTAKQILSAFRRAKDCWESY